MPKLQKVGYEEDVKKFESARKGDIVNIRTNPRLEHGFNQEIKLTDKT